MADERTRDEIEKETRDIKEEIQNFIYEAGERAWLLGNAGLVVGEGANRLYSGPGGFEAPKFHPVWADALRYELEKLREMGEAGTVKKREYEVDYVTWPRADVLERLGERVREPRTSAQQTSLWGRAAQAQRERRAIEETPEPGRDRGR